MLSYSENFVVKHDLEISLNYTYYLHVLLLFLRGKFFVQNLINITCIMQTKKRNLLLIIKIKFQNKLKVDTYILTIKIKSTITKT